MSELSLLLSLLDEAFDHKSWHGTTLLGSTRGVDAATARWRPSKDRHNIWEVIVHAAYWKYAVRRRLTGDKRASFALAGSNWFERPQDPRASAKLQTAALKADVRLLVAEHRALRHAVEGLPASALTGRRGAHDRTSRAYLIRGIAAHDLYHAGQIQLLKRLRGS